MHVDQPLRSGALVQIVDILGDQQQLARPLSIEPRQRLVRVIWLDGPQPRPPRVVEGVDQRRVPPIRLGRGDVLDPVAFPQPVGPAEGREPAFGGNAGSGQDHDVADVHAVQNRAARR